MTPTAPGEPKVSGNALDITANTQHASCNNMQKNAVHTLQHTHRQKHIRKTRRRQQAKITHDTKLHHIGIEMAVRVRQTLRAINLPTPSREMRPNGRVR